MYCCCCRQLIQWHSVLRLRDVQHVRDCLHRPAHPSVRHLRPRHIRRDLPKVGPGKRGAAAAGTLASFSLFSNVCDVHLLP